MDEAWSSESTQKTIAFNWENVNYQYEIVHMNMLCLRLRIRPRAASSVSCDCYHGVWQVVRGEFHELNLMSSFSHELWCLEEMRAATQRARFSVSIWRAIASGWKQQCHRITQNTYGWQFGEPRTHLHIIEMAYWALMPAFPITCVPYIIFANILSNSKAIIYTLRQIHSRF